MSWNEPGGGNKDPWSGRNDKNGPPDLDEAIRSLQEKLGGIFGGGSGGGGPAGGSSMKGLGFIIAAVLAIWGLSGFYIVDEGTQGVVTRFGAYTETTQSGLNWHLPAPIEQVQVIDIMKQRFIEVGYRSGGRQGMGSVPREALMLTKDENIVDVRLAVQYQVKDAKDFAFNVLNPLATLKQVTESVERGVVGNNNMDFVLTEGRSEVVLEIKKEIQEVMDAYKAGVLITSVNLQDAQPPEQVQSAFEDAIKAREDKQRLINEAEAYSNDVIPKARGAASRRVQEAEGYLSQVVAEATGEVSRFTQILEEYKKAPKVTRQRIYLESMEHVLANTDTVMVDVKGGNNLLYLPLDKMSKRPNVQAQSSSVEPASSFTPKSTQIVNNNLRTSSRGRDVRGR
ncbi:FtsH protease activity modulator HflK [Methylomarinum sp. Ch1-1]|uniref:Protein HflK n=1 Tax=Methylomarinum roseum TaxID=3067653 RepID=A0AAU7NSL5_9GAMM|nr:FtsH protease activity modulator HflK [Methylomarinum sp. Ch1-1]MDP4520028.1 FtsH protease activity modulator HflK [Methylomarinum sp. Ch1-1]